MALAVLAESLGVKYDFIDAIQSDNAKLRGVLTGKESDVSQMMTDFCRDPASIPVLLGFERPVN